MKADGTRSTSQYYCAGSHNRTHGLLGQHSSCKRVANMPACSSHQLAMTCRECMCGTSSGMLFQHWRVLLVCTTAHRAGSRSRHLPVQQAQPGELHMCYWQLVGATAA